ncbi:LapA family protein [uncultured Mycolicibacterium sp.]|uniref:LapA family protein n=1 Tax=uncultured Mycolicibacterium sp. TaxID=2320817 RepID=UPI00261F8956|nr:LapA family protein [uncultured Mycolicibacterium sp.]
MKGAYRDPVDHARTTLPHSGEGMIDTRLFPGLILIALGVAGLAAIVAAAAYGRPDLVLPLALVTGAVVTAGFVLIVLEHQRVLRAEREWERRHRHHRNLHGSAA